MGGAVGALVGAAVTSMEVGGWVVFHFNADIWNGGWNTAAVIGTSTPAAFQIFAGAPSFFDACNAPVCFPLGSAVKITTLNLKCHECTLSAPAEHQASSRVRVRPELLLLEPRATSHVAGGGGGPACLGAPAVLISDS